MQPDQPSLAVVLMDAATARNVPARPAAAAGGGFGTQGGPVLHGNATSRLPASAEVRQPKATVPAPANQPGGEARQPVRLDFAVYDVPADTPEWKALGEAKDLPAALKELADKGAVRVVAKPSLVTFSGTTGNIHVAERVALTDERVAAAGGAMGAADNDFAGAGQGPAQTLRATPTVQPDGRILLVAEVELEQWVQVRDARDSGFGVLAKRTVTARLLLEPGHVAVLRGLGRISSTTYDGEARQPVETFVTVEASLAASTAAPAP
ncbi:MAG: hypothetical protein HYU66_09500 [Armatimonadetes bacterium]|nr:hypothetical protein [Armatimonadota bacterium]